MRVTYRRNKGTWTLWPKTMATEECTPCVNFPRWSLWFFDPAGRERVAGGGREPGDREPPDFDGSQPPRGRALKGRENPPPTPRLQSCHHLLIGNEPQVPQRPTQQAGSPRKKALKLIMRWGEVPQHRKGRGREGIRACIPIMRTELDPSGPRWS